MEFHPLTEKYPLLEGEEYEKFKAAVEAANGCRLSILTYQGQIIDGRNRYRACVDLGLDPPMKEWIGPIDELEKFIDWLNRDRRHLTAESRRKMIAWQLKRDPSQSDRFTAEMVGCSTRMVAEVRDEMKAAGDVPPTKTKEQIKQEIIDFIKENPGVSNNAIAEKFSIRRHDVIDIRNEMSNSTTSSDKKDSPEGGDPQKTQQDREPGDDSEEESQDGANQQSGAPATSGKTGGGRKPGPRETLKRWLAEGKINQRVYEKCSSMKGQKLKHFMAMVNDGVSVADAIATVETSIEDGSEEFAETDAIGVAIPESIKHVFAMRKKFEDARSLLEKAQKLVHEICDSDSGRDLLGEIGIEVNSSNGIDTFSSKEISSFHFKLKCHEPYSSVCPSCAEHNPGKIDKKCPVCKGESWVTKWCWDRSPADYRQKVLSTVKGTEPAAGKWGKSVVDSFEIEIDSSNSYLGLAKRLREIEVIKDKLGTEYHRLKAKIEEKMVSVVAPEPEFATTSTEG